MAKSLLDRIEWMATGGHPDQYNPDPIWREIHDALLLCEHRKERTHAALCAAKDAMLFFHEMCGYAPEAVRTVIHQIDDALNQPRTPLLCTTDHLEQTP